MSPVAVEITVERLVVEGLDVPAAQALGRAFEIELTRLIREQGLPDSFGSDAAQPVIEVRDVAVGAMTPPYEAGQALAESVYRSLR